LQTACLFVSLLVGWLVDFHVVQRG
jgi:hypothetical protein